MNTGIANIMRKKFTSNSGINKDNKGVLIGKEEGEELDNSVKLNL